MMDAPGRRKWLALVPVAMGVFVVVMDVTVVNVALPSIRADLGYLDVTVSDLGWIVNAYSLAFGVLMLAGGKLADIFGRRRIFMIGLVLFALSSLAAGLAEDVQLVIICRGLQGVGGALVLPASLSIITVGFPAAQRAIAVAIWSTLVGVGVAVGPLVGGVLSEKADWRWVFFVAIPFSVLAFAFSMLWIKESRATPEHRRFDPIGVALSAAALFCLVFGLQKANEWDWSDPRIVALLAGAAGLGLAFALYERRAPAPMLDISLFRSATFTAANVVSLVSGFVLIGTIFYLNLFTQSVMAYEPIEAGAVLLPMTVLTVAAAPVAGRLTDAFGPRWVLAGGMLLIGGALLTVVRLDLESGFWSLVPMLLLEGIGFAFVLTPVTAAALAGVPVRQAGIGAGAVNAARQVGGALGLAVLGAVNAEITDDALAVGRTRLEGFVDSFGPIMIVGAAGALLGAVIAAAWVVGRMPAAAAAPVAEPAARERPSGVTRVSWTIPAPEAGRSVAAATAQHELLTGLLDASVVARLEVINGPVAGSTVGISADGMILGRAEDGIGDLGGDQELSRRHARIYQRNGELILEDLGSMDGTRVGGRVISEATALAVGDVIELGRTQLRVSQVPGPVATAPAGEATRAREVGLELEVVEGPAAGRRLRFGRAPFVLGRAERGEGSLAGDPELSRRHASATPLGPAGILIEDLGSTNGTFVNGLRIGGPTLVALGDSVQVGGTKLKVTQTPAPAGAAVAGDDR
jgi:EmrB/QacA subfamily drug resistance transporter